MNMGMQDYITLISKWSNLTTLLQQNNSLIPKPFRTYSYRFLYGRCSAIKVTARMIRMGVIPGRDYLVGVNAMRYCAVSSITVELLWRSVNGLKPTFIR